MWPYICHSWHIILRVKWASAERAWEWGEQRWTRWSLGLINPVPSPSMAARPYLLTKEGFTALAMLQCITYSSRHIRVDFPAMENKKSSLGWLFGMKNKSIYSKSCSAGGYRRCISSCAIPQYQIHLTSSSHLPVTSEGWGKFTSGNSRDSSTE